MRDDAFNDTDLAEKIARPPERYLEVLRDFCGLVELNFDEVMASGEVTLNDVHIGFLHFGAINPTCMKIIVDLNLPPSERKESLYLQLLQANAVLPMDGLAFASVPDTDRPALTMTISLDEKHGLTGQQLHDKILALAELSTMGKVLADQSFGRAVFAGFNKI